MAREYLDYPEIDQEIGAETKRRDHLAKFVYVLLEIMGVKSDDWSLEDIANFIVDYTHSYDALEFMKRFGDGHTTCSN